MFHKIVKTALLLLCFWTPSICITDAENASLMAQAYCTENLSENFHRKYQRCYYDAANLDWDWALKCGINSHPENRSLSVYLKLRHFDCSGDQWTKVLKDHHCYLVLPQFERCLELAPNYENPCQVYVDDYDYNQCDRRIWAQVVRCRERLFRDKNSAPGLRGPQATVISLTALTLLLWPVMVTFRL